MWFRARGQKWKGNDVLIVELIDIGSIYEMKAADVRKISSEFLTEVQLFDCVIDQPIRDPNKLVKLARATTKIESTKSFDSDTPIHKISFDWDTFIVRQ